MYLAAESVGMRVGSRSLFTNLSFKANAGSTTAVMGPSGVGKSTLLGALAGLIPLSAGTIALEGWPPDARVSWMFQTAPLLYRRSAIDNVALALEVRGFARDEALDEAADLLGRVGLSGVANSLAHRLSGGERQRVAVARAVATRAQLLLADEPTASLDPDSRAYVVDALSESASQGAVVVLATHDPWVAGNCDQVIDLQEFSSGVSV